MCQFYTTFYVRWKIQLQSSESNLSFTLTWFFKASSKAWQRGKHPKRVFTFAGQPIVNANTRAWRNALKRAGIENFRWHDLRHTWASWHRMQGTPTHELQQLGGWRTGAMVERYAHLTPDHLASAAARLDSVMNGYDLATSAKK